MCKISLNVTTISVRGIQSRKNRRKKISTLLEKNCDVVCAQELRLKCETDIKEVNKLWTAGEAVISIDDNRADGVGIFFKQDIDILIIREIIPGRILLVDGRIGSKKLGIINVYTPPDRAGKMRIFYKLYELLCVGFNTIFNTTK